MTRNSGLISRNSGVIDPCLKGHGDSRQKLLERAPAENGGCGFWTLCVKTMQRMIKLSRKQICSRENQENRFHVDWERFLTSSYIPW